MFVSFFFSVLKLPYKQKKKVSTLAEPMHGGQNSWVTCSPIQPLSTSPPAVLEYCEAVSTEQSQQTLCLLSLRLQSVCDNSPSLHAQSCAFITPYRTAMVSVFARPMLCLMCRTTTAPLHNHSVAVDLSQLPENSCRHHQQVLPANNYSVPLDRYILIVEVVC